MFSKKYFFSVTLITSMIVYILTPLNVSATIVKDVTGKMELLGKPFNKQTYARNVWDMQVYNGSIYLGHGNSSNNAPAANSGPIDVIKYNPDKKTFETEYTVFEEQIDVFKIINGKLTIPGHDSRESWSFGNYYVLDSAWSKVRTIPKGVHVYDMASYNGKLYAATGTNAYSEVVCSADNGQTWAPVKPTDGTSFVTAGARAYTLFEYKGILYASSIFVNVSSLNNNFLAISGDNVTATKVSGASMFPGLSSISILKLIRPTVFNNTQLFIAGTVSNDHQYIPVALYATTDVKSSRKISFPESNVLPYDIIVRGSSIYVLASIKNSTSNYTNIVYTSNDLNSWSEVLSFRSEAFARSFEELNGEFYFGLGCDTVDMSEASGSILKVSLTEPAPVPIPESDPIPVATTPVATTVQTPTPVPEPTPAPTPVPEPAPAPIPVPEPVPAPPPAPSPVVPPIIDEKNVNDKLQLLGNPFSKKPYAKNVWDMQLFNDAIYLGHGNSSDYLFDTNAGAIDVIKYDTVEKTFVNEYTVNENQIDIYKILNGKLYIPGHEHLDAVSFGNFYTLNEQWNKTSTVANAKNIYDMAEYNGKLYAAGRIKDVSAVFVSSDNGLSWKPVKTTDGTTFVTPGNTAYSFFQYKGSLYASGVLVNARSSSGNNLLKITGDKVTSINITGTKMFPGLTNTVIMKLSRPVEVNNQLLFVAGKIINQHQIEPMGLYASTDVGVSRKIIFEESTAMPYDILVRGETVYVLASKRLASNNYKNIVYVSNDLDTWTEVMNFSTDTFTRSFEELNGDFYFGLGCNTGYAPNTTGNILKVSKSDY